MGSTGHSGRVNTASSGPARPPEHYSRGRVEPVAALGIPLYNHADLLPAALDSLLAQNRRDLALVLVDDRSTDATPEVARAYASSDPRVSYEQNAARLGLVGNWRRAAFCS